MPKFPATRRIVLRNFPGRLAVMRLALGRQWEKCSDTRAEYNDSGAVQRAEVMWTVRPGIAFFYVENDLSDDCCVGFISSGPSFDAEIERLLEDVDCKLDTWSPAELLDEADRAQSVPDLARAIVRVGLGAPVAFDQEFYERIDRAASHPDRTVRAATIVAAMYPAWPELRRILRRLAQTDPEESVRIEAVSILDSYDRVGVPQL